MSKFRIEYNMKDRGLPTLFKYQYFTIDKKERMNWDYENLNDYMGDYSLHISTDVMNKFAHNEIISSALADLEESESNLTISKNMSDRYSGNKQYIKCRITKYILKTIKKIFISTLVYESANLEIQESESLVFVFDTDKKAVDSLSVEAIGINQYSVENEKSVKDFYDRSQMSPWKERNKLEKESEIASRAGVYMLYDENANSFYVGKAIQLKERMIQHTKNPNDPIPNFTHYRYSVISPEYYEFLYLIENAAIHDFAWLLDMPAAKKYTPSLVKKLKIVDLSSCHMVNTAEHQTRKQ